MEEPSHISVPDGCSLPCCEDGCLFTGEAIDVVLVTNRRQRAVACSDFVIRFPFTQQRRQDLLSIKVVLGSPNMSKKRSQNEEKDNGLDMICRRSGEIVFCQGLSTKPSVDALLRLCATLKPGRNQARYLLTSLSNKGLATCIGVAHFSIYLWASGDRIVVSDIDGTITKSNVRGVLDTVVLERHVYAHRGVCKFLSAISEGERACENSSVRILYLTSRPMSLAQSTRDFLFQLEQSDGCQLPPGPLFCHPGHLGHVLFSEWISKDVHEYKSDILFRQIILPFAAVDASTQEKHSPIVVGFGNSTADAMAYEMAGVHRSSIFIIDKQSNVSCIDKQSKSDASSQPTTDGSLSSKNFRNSPRSAWSSRVRDKTALVRKRKDYRKLIGTVYQGYEDQELLSVVKTKLRSTETLKRNSVPAT